MISNEEMRKRFSHNALESVKNFDIKITVEKNIELYERIIGL